LRLYDDRRWPPMTADDDDDDDGDGGGGIGIGRVYPA
jgi:hypothetical protein